MFVHRIQWFIVGAFLLQAAHASAGGKTDFVLKKAEALTADDNRDTKLKMSYAKVYKVQLTEGKAYRIDLGSKDFDSFLRVENSDGKELAFHDDIDYPANTNSRLIFVAPKTGEYRLIATSFEPNKIGDFTLEAKPASAAEAVAAVLFTRVEKTATLEGDDRKQLIQDVTKYLQGQGGKFSADDVKMANFLTFHLENADIVLSKSAYQDLGKVFADVKDPRLASAVKPFTMVGNPLKITGKTVDGKDFDLKNLKGKVVLVDFWATWCGPCIAEIPNIRKAQERYKDKGFEIIGISLDRTDDAITKFVEDRKIPWNSINIADSRKLATEYGVNAIPFPVLVDQEGRVVSFRARGPLLERHLELLLGEKK